MIETIDPLRDGMTPRVSGLSSRKGGVTVSRGWGSRSGQGMGPFSFEHSKSYRHPVTGGRVVLIV